MCNVYTDINGCHPLTNQIQQYESMYAICVGTHLIYCNHLNPCGVGLSRIPLLRDGQFFSASNMVTGTPTSECFCGAFLTCGYPGDPLF